VLLFAAIKGPLAGGYRGGDPGLRGGRSARTKAAIKGHKAGLVNSQVEPADNPPNAQKPAIDPNTPLVSRHVPLIIPAASGLV
jgi:hypothetical protein